LREKIGDKITHVHGRLIVASAPVLSAAWVANVWLDPIHIPINSISDGAQKLRSIQRNWALYSFASHCRAALIEDKLPSVSAKPLVFGADPPKAPLGSWALLDPNTILASAHCSSPFPNGEVRFVEDRWAPPSRAYLELWEFFTLFFARRPKPGDLCLDLGASPGGWTWVLQQLGARVIASISRISTNGSLPSQMSNIDGARARSRSSRTPSAKSIGSFPTSSVIRGGCWRWSRSGLRRA
jgi:23S rRNA (cytidine2498-2'-O)-methyltransferase